MRQLLYTIIAVFFFVSANCAVLDLSGQWTVRLDPQDEGINMQWPGKLYEQSLHLPGTTDDAGLGIPDTTSLGLGKTQLSNLIRRNSYIGAAWYSKEIKVPSNWKEKILVLNLERVIWQSRVWVDGVELPAAEESLVSPHHYDLTKYIRPGKQQVITICIDNRKKYDISVRDMAHAYTNQTQIIWNGVIGDINIEAYEKIRIDNMQIFPDVDAKKIRIKLSFINQDKRPQKLKLNLHVKSKRGAQCFPVLKKDVVVNKGISYAEYDYSMGDDVKLWDEFSPELYTLHAKLGNKSESVDYTDDFGLRKISTKGNELRINNKPLFLRGTLECAIFPLTGYPPMDHDGWEKVFMTAKNWGLNHLRFHSWCPPKAAFEVADRMGMYLQIELPIWSVDIEDKEQPQKFMREEGQRIIKVYGNHPSFCFWSMGNELQKDIPLINKIMSELKAEDSRHLYTTTSFTFEKGHGAWPEPGDDYFITQWTNKGWVRGQGVFNQYSPSFDKDYRTAVDSMPVPLITHEIGQYSVYPDLKEIEKYKGVLKPVNFLSIKQDLKEKGLLQKAESYLQSSGKLAAILYKEEVERALKTPGISGFQLLDLHDFPGQGTALVGLLNAFWESKGVIEDTTFREFCAPVVPLLRFKKASYYNNETFSADIEVSNYGKEKINNKKISWIIRQGQQIIKSGSCDVRSLLWGHNSNIGKIEVPLNEIDKAAQLQIELIIENTPFKNNWNIWVYPADQQINFGKVKYTRNYHEAFSLLQKGEIVLFNPDWKLLKGIEGKFVPVFWSPVHFPKQAGTMGVLCEPSHKALAMFPTESNTNWQWWDLNINSTTLIVDGLKGFTPVVEMIDNFANNRRLASLLEGKFGKGKFMLAAFDLQTDIQKRPVARQMLISLLNYMNGQDFNPSEQADFEKLTGMINDAKNENKADATSIY
ncbi:MAG: glycoside hydrolase family 2 TIM barrel-domain containing protein [Paludibacter sp.]|nr:glycoside hydrolase family 2 TIM barrel-domain containing protein [Paludibacter sp.]